MASAARTIEIHRIPAGVRERVLKIVCALSLAAAGSSRPSVLPVTAAEARQVVDRYFNATNGWARPVLLRCCPPPPPFRPYSARRNPRPFLRLPRSATPPAARPPRTRPPSAR